MSTDYAATIATAIGNNMPYSSEILDVISGALGELPVPLPPGSHIVLPDGTRGVDVVALRTTWRGTAQVLTEYGDWTWLKAGEQRNNRLVIGRAAGRAKAI